MKKVILALDLGGTHLRFGALDRKAPHRVYEVSSKSAPQDFAQLAQGIDRFLKSTSFQPVGLAIAVAGPVDEEGVFLTNLGWRLSLAHLQELSLGPVTLLNDLMAHAAGLEFTQEDLLYPLQPGKPRSGNRALIAAGTGLGEALLVQQNGGWIPVPSEGGHCDFAPTTDEEIRLLNFLRDKTAEPICWEDVVSGAHGWPNLTQFILSQKDTIPQSYASLPPNLGAFIHSQAEKACPIASEVMSLFARLYAREAGNLALKGLAVGGVYIGGGIAPKILKFLDTQEFREAFCHKHRYRTLLEAIPIKVVQDEHLALKGAAHWLRQEHPGAAVLDE